MIWNYVRKHWKSFVIVLTPLAYLPLPLLVQDSAARCAYVILIMATYWTTEAVHLSVTALMPIFAFPLLGILSTKDVCIVYMKDTNMLFWGGLAIAVAVEHSGLHERIALYILLKVGSTPRRLLLGFMMSQMFLSMWISNTAATAMMVPIIDAVLDKINKKNDQMQIEMETQFTNEAAVYSVESDFEITKENGETYDKGSSEHNSVEMLHKEKTAGPTDRELNNLRDIIYLGVAYSSNIGGTGSLTGTNPNLVLMGFLNIWYPGGTGLNYATWLAYNVPGMLLCTLFGYGWLTILLYFMVKRHRCNQQDESKAAVTDVLQDKLDALGHVTFQEKTVTTMFVAVVLLWMFLKPEFIDGWGDLIKGQTGVSIGGATPAMFIVFLLFVIPIKPFWSKNVKVGDEPSVGCLTWEVLHHKLQWGVIMLMGGGFALAEAGKVSGLSAWMGDQFKVFNNFPKELTLFLVCVMTALLTEVMSNTAAASILLPVLNNMAVGIKVHPLYFLLPVTLCCSYAFMLPVATPPNAIVFESARTMPITRMIAAGSVMNILCILSVTLMSNTLGVYMFDTNSFPEWANGTISY